MESPHKILALDVGDRRTGVAISDESQIFSFPLLQFEAQGRKDWTEKAVQVIADEEPGSIVVGVPFDQNGEEGPAAKKIRKHIAALQERVKVPVIEWDERYTTVQAEEALLEGDVSRRKRKQVIDKIAASFILQSYIESLKQ